MPVMNDLPDADREDDKPANFIAIALVVIRNWRIALLSVIVAVLLALFYLRVTAPSYDAEMVVAPATDNNLTPNLGSSLGGISGLASAAGIRLPDSETVTPFAKFIELTQSEALADRIQKKYNFLKFFNRGRWDWSANQWRPATGILSQMQQIMAAVTGVQKPTNPTSFDLAKILQERLTIEIIPKTGMRRIGFSDRDPKIAVFFLTVIHNEADEMLREDAQSRSNRQIAYLRERLQTVTVNEERTALSNLLEVQEQQAMLSESGLAFAAHLVEPPMVSDRPTSPKPSVVLLSAIVLGTFVGALLAIARMALTNAQGPWTFSHIFFAVRRLVRL